MSITQLGPFADSTPGHVNNVIYVRYSESARVNWAANYATTIDPGNKSSWEALWSPRGIGMILRSIKVDYKFVSCCRPSYHQVLLRF